MIKICLVTCYIGKLPDYFSYFSETCLRNPEVNFLIFNDEIESSITDRNLRIEKISLQEFNQLATQKLGCPVAVTKGYKLCDFKPGYGKIFEEFLKEFDFWGYCDLDLIFGNIRSFITEELLHNYDVISAKDKWISGHFALFRNSGRIRNLYELSPDWQRVFSDSTFNYFFEESARRWKGEYFSYQDLKERNQIVSLYDIVLNESRMGNLKVRFFTDIVREHPDPVNYVYEEGRLRDLNTQTDFMYFHLLIVKVIWRFYIPRLKTLPDRFYITAGGIYSAGEARSLLQIKWKMQRAFFCAKGIIHSIGKQSVRSTLSKALAEAKRIL